VTENTTTEWALPTPDDNNLDARLRAAANHHWAASPEPKKTGLATAAMVLGIIAVCTGLIPILGMIALPCGVLAVIFGLIGLKRRKGFAITGLVTGLLGFILAICGLVIVNNAINHVDKCFDAISADAHNRTNTSDAACHS
jgi:hypothetical protein